MCFFFGRTRVPCNLGDGKDKVPEFSHHPFKNHKSKTSSCMEHMSSKFSKDLGSQDKLKIIVKEQTQLIKDQSEIMSEMASELSSLKETCKNLLLTNECLDTWQRDGLETMQELVTENDQLIAINKRMATDYQNLQKVNTQMYQDLRELRPSFQMDLF